jgi:uncharacterized protein (DUF1800 family)
MASINPLNQLLGTRFSKHLLRRATMRYSKQDIDTFATMTVDAAVDQLFVLIADPIAEPQDPEDTLPYWINNVPVQSISSDARKKNYVKGAWLYNGISSATIKHKLMLFLFNQFTVSTVTGKSTQFYDYLKLLEYYALGSVQDLALKVTFDNLMLKYLDNNTNVKNNPNENYARELLELFTIGKGPQVAPGNYTNYTEADIIQASKVLTGIRVDNSRSFTDADTGLPTGYVNLSKHDLNDKTFSAAFQNTVLVGANSAIDVVREINDFVSLVFNQSATAKHICRRIYRFFVKDSISTEVENDIIVPLSLTLQQHNYELAPVVKQLLKSAHFYDKDDSNDADETIGAMLKSPLQLLTEVVTLLEINIPDPDTDAINFYKKFCHGFLGLRYFPASGMPLFEPTSVAGYPAYYQAPNYSRYWFDSSTIIGRYKLFESFVTGRNQVAGNTALIGFVFNVVDCVSNNSLFNDPENPETLVRDLVDYLFPEAIDNDRFNYFYQDIFLDGMMPYNWTTAWNDFLVNQDDSVVKPRLEQLFTFLINSPEFQTY